MPVGDYNYEATTTISGKKAIKKGKFVVHEIKLESINTVADHQLLYYVSNTTNGELFHAKDIQYLAEKINAREDIKSISFVKKSLLDLINLKELFFLILAFVSIEWILRKRSGSY